MSRVISDLAIDPMMFYDFAEAVLTKVQYRKDILTLVLALRDREVTLEINAVTGITTTSAKSRVKKGKQWFTI